MGSTCCFEIVTVPLVIAVEIPVPPANFNVSLPSVIVSDVDESSTIVKSEDTLVFRNQRNTTSIGMSISIKSVYC